MLALVGLPTLFPQLVEARAYAERMFRVIELSRLSEKEVQLNSLRSPLSLVEAALRCDCKVERDQVYL